MKYILLNLSGCLQAYGTEKNGGFKPTNLFPSKSAIFGMICASMGRSGELAEFLEKLNSSVKTDVFAYTDNNILYDFQTIGSNYPDNSKMIPKSENNKTSGSQLVSKAYIVGSKFLVCLSVDDDTLAEEISKRLQNPIWPIYLGRKCCIPSEPVFSGMFDDKSSLKDYINKCKRKLSAFITEDIISDFDEQLNLNDVPVNFGISKKYAYRTVYIKYYYDESDFQCSEKLAASCQD